jgi:ATP-dependent DNA ligase
LAQRHGVGGRLLTRNGRDWTDRYPTVLKALMALKIQSCLIDGEVVICDEHGVAEFDRLRHGPRVKPGAVLYAFDLLELDGEDLRAMPIEIRKRKLGGLLAAISSILVWGYTLVTATPEQQIEASVHYVRFVPFLPTASVDEKIAGPYPRPRLPGSARLM